MKLRASLFISIAAFASLIASSFADGPSNPPIDLTIPLAAEPATDVAVFDETVVFAPNFTLDQNDPALSDLFSKAGTSNLCFPTSFAEALIYLKAYSNPMFGNLQLQGMSADGKTIDPNALIRQLATACHTDSETGTFDYQALNCTLQLLYQSNYGSGNTQLISPFDLAQPGVPILNRAVTIQDLRNSLSAGRPVILELAWFKFDGPTKSWIRDSGHYVAVFGYDYDKAWGENEIQLKVVNPETNYGSSRQYAQFDTITIERYATQPGVVYPPNRAFIASGAGFGGAVLRGFVGTMLTVDPAIRPGTMN
jgi:hypothetical protein